MLRLVSSALIVLGSPALRQTVKLILDGSFALLALASSLALLQAPWPHAITALSWVFLVLAGNVALGLTRQHYRMVGFNDATRLAKMGLYLGVLGLAAYALRLGFSVWLIAGLFTVIAWLGLRATVRALCEDRRTLPQGEGQRVLIAGAGKAGVLVNQELRRHSELGYRVVGFLDDDLSKQGVMIQGFPVLGPQEMLPLLVETYEIQSLIIAIPSASGPEIRKLHDSALALGLQVKTVPGLFNLLGHQDWKPELRDISIEDLLRRDPVQLDQSAIRQQIRERTVLITGAGGSIGSELARQVAAFAPATLVLLGRGEGSLWLIEQELRQRFPDLRIQIELCDIRHRSRLRQAFERWRPEVVYHAAAHKHVPYLEAHPEEAIENNVFGTRNVADMALAFGTTSFVNVSTDKSINPTNVLGASKFLAERVVLQAASQAGPGQRFGSVRFGNVLGSRGSVIRVFQEQMQPGGRLTVTHPDMKRYFMTIPEASQLVLQAGALGENAKVYVLDMGEPVKIVDLAMDMARLSGLRPGVDIQIEFTGLRPGEKLFEELFNEHEIDSSSVHPKVREASLIPLDAFSLQAGLERLSSEMSLPEKERRVRILEALRQLVPTYTPCPSGLGSYGAEPRQPLLSQSTGSPRMSASSAVV